MNENKNKVAEQNFGLVHSCCKRFIGRGIEYEELFSAGCLGLSKAINNFDSSLNFQFSTYAFYLICGEIKRLFRDGGAVKVSRSLKELSLKISKFSSSFIMTEGREPTVGEIAEKLCESPEKVAQALDCARPVESLSTDRGEGVLTVEIPIDDIQYEISERLTLRQIISSLDKPDRLLIELRYYSGLTQSKTAEKLGMTQVQVSRREKKILASIRSKMQ